jgi:hypothetical protein
LEEYNCENLLCLLELQHYKTFSFPDLKTQRTAANYIYVYYFDSNSPLEVNIASKVRSASSECIRTCLDHVQLRRVFSAIEVEVVSMLGETFKRFKESVWYDIMRQDVGFSSNVFGGKERERLMQWLRSWMIFEQQNVVEEVPTIPFLDDRSSPTLRPEKFVPLNMKQATNRDFYVAELVKEFCVQLLDIEEDALAQYLSKPLVVETKVVEEVVKVPVLQKMRSFDASILSVGFKMGKRRSLEHPKPLTLRRRDQERGRSSEPSQRLRSASAKPDVKYTRPVATQPLPKRM